MCELFGVSANYDFEYNELLKEFYGHSNNHPHGWGLAVIDGEDVMVEKEPLQASRSFYLHERLSVPITGEVLMAHIRYATIGNLGFSNCHPFTGKDISGRRWTMIHNGTIFECDQLQKYVKKQQGETDSERIFLYMLDLMNEKISEGCFLDGRERFQVLDEMVAYMAKGNKLNIMFYDGEYFYVHTNSEHSLYYSEQRHMAKFATTPIGNDEWKPMPMTTLLAYKNGDLAFTGTNHGNAYIENPEQVGRLYQIFANL